MVKLLSFQILCKITKKYSTKLACGEKIAVKSSKKSIEKERPAAAGREEGQLRALWGMGLRESAGRVDGVEFFLD